MTTIQTPTASAVTRPVPATMDDVRKGVRRTLKGEQGTPSGNDALALYRGLLHSNRKQMTISERRSLVDSFLPVLSSVCESLSERCQAALPWSVDTRASARLLQNLQSEQIRALELLQEPCEGSHSDAATHLNDIERSLSLLVDQAEAAVNCVPTLARRNTPECTSLVSAARTPSVCNRFIHLSLIGSGDEATDLAALLYRYLLLISLADLHTLRVAQLPAMLAFLVESAHRVQLHAMPTPSPHAITDFGLDLEHDAPPAPCARVLATGSESARHVDIAPLIEHINQHLERLKTSSLPVPETEHLQRTSLLRLRSALLRDNARRIPRRPVHRQQDVQIGFRAVCLGLATAGGSGGSVAVQGGAAPAAQVDVWTLTNESELGCELVSLTCGVGRVQVGELVNLHDVDRPITASSNGRVKVSLGVIRWLRESSPGTLRIGVEFLGSSLLPVNVIRPEGLSNPASTASAFGGVSKQPLPVSQESFIMTCKLEGKVLQTLILPVYHEFRQGEVLQLSIGEKTRMVRLQVCLQNNGLFSQFTVVDP